MAPARLTVPAVKHIRPQIVLSRNTAFPDGGYMTNETDVAPLLVGHGATKLPSVIIDSFNVEAKDEEGFLGDRANKGAFRSILHDWRERVAASGKDPLGKVDSETISRKELDEILASGDPEAAGIIHGAVEDFAKELSLIIRRFLKLKAWQDTQRLVIGGGFRESRVGELAIGRTAVLLKAAEIEIETIPIRNHPDEAGLIGAIHLAPSWIFKAHDAILAVDIGGTNIRAGVVELNLKKAKDLSKAAVWKAELWRHADEKIKREGAVERLVEMLEELIGKSEKEKLKLAPFIGIGCPGIIQPDGSIERGAQNLPGNWESSKFNLPALLREAIPKISKEETHVVMHNDAVVQGLSEVPFMQDIDHWGVFTIGTGLGNARFTNRHDD
jgi:predicted NBD/HSP70 family sugar kinase